MARQLSRNLHAFTARDEIGRLTWREALAVVVLGNAGLWLLAYVAGWCLS